MLYVYNGRARGFFDFARVRYDVHPDLGGRAPWRYVTAAAVGVLPDTTTISNRGTAWRIIGR